MARRSIVTRVTIVARKVKDPFELVTIEADDPVWTCNRIEKAIKHCQAAFVRIRPPADATDDRIEEVVRCVRLYALVVQVATKPKAGVLIESDKVHAKQTARDVVLQLVESANSKDKEVLRTRVEETLGKVGL